MSVQQDQLRVRAPEGVIDANIARLLKEHKQELLAWVQSEAASGVRSSLPPRITPDMLPLVALRQAEIDAIVARVADGAANVQDIYPLAPLQEGILFHHVLDTEGDAYLLRTVLAFDKRERRDAFLGALQAVIARHDILRSTMHWEGLAQAVQVVQRRARLPVLPFAPAAPDQILAQLLAHTDPRHTRLSLHSAPLMAAHTVFDPELGEWLLSLLYHHIVCDHVTLDLIMAEIDTILHGEGWSLAPALPYRDFIAQARSIAPAEHEAYFRRQLGDIDAPSAPFGLLDIQGNGARLAEARLTLDPALAAGIRQCARQQGVTPAVLFHLAWAQVVGQCSGRDDVVFGTVVSGRLQGSAGADQVLGMFINTLPLRVSLGGRSAAELVADTYQRLSELLLHEQASLALAQRCSGVPPALPLFTALFNYRHGASGDAAPAWEGMRVLADEERTNYPLGISVDDLGTDFALTAQCVTAIDPARLTDYLCTAVEALVAALGQSAPEAIHAPCILPDRERQQLLFDFNDNRRALPAQQLIHQFVESHAAARPDALALVFEKQELSYGALNRRANQLAHHLLALGLRPDQRVAICAEPSLEMVIAVIAVLKAGGAYVPLDPDYPPERIAGMLTDSEPALLLTQAHLAPRLSAHAIPVVDLDAALPAGQEEHNPHSAALGLRPDHLAYLIYTSGSTGVPKAVMVPHSALCNLAAAQGATFGVHGDSRLLQFVSFAFDVWIGELGTAFYSGASLHLAAREDLHPGSTLLTTCAQHRITHLSLPLPALAALPPDADTSTIETIVVGGDACPPPLARHWASRVKLFNAYGPTETTVCATSHHCRDEDCVTLPIGRPLANTAIYLLDAQLRPVPLGVAGEIYIGGAGVARGYWKRPELTAARFIPDPFGGDARLYKTGDLGRWRDDGALEYLGRNDFQVKIRGYRIEPGEIEARLAVCPGVRDAVVLARADGFGEKRLVAYVTGPEALQAPALRARLAAELPDHMVPSAFVQLETWPLTPNGKLDRAALPAPGDDAHASRAYAAPQGDTEIAVAHIWQTLLGLEQVGRHDHFFELGGHSLLAVQVIGRLRRDLGIDVPVRELFSAPELAAFARRVRAARQAALPPIVAVPRNGPPALSAMQQRLWLLDRLDHKAGAAYHMPAALRLQGRLDRAALQAALDRLVARHESLRTTFALHAGQPAQIIAADNARFALRTTDLRALPADAREAAAGQLAQEAVSAPFSLSEGPLIRGHLLQLGDDDHILLVVQHHIISDGWSIGVMIDEFNALYAAFSQGQPDPLPPLAIQYADYAIWQRRHLEGAERQAHVDFWRGHLQGAPGLLALPTDRPRPATPSHAGALFEFALDAGLAASVRRLSQQHGCTTFMTLLAAWSALMARMAGQDDVVIGTPVANRQHAEVEGLIGFFVNTLALRIHVDPGQSAADLLSQIKANTLAAYAHQDLPFEQVVDAVQPARSAGHSPLFQVMLAWDNTPAKAALALPGLTVSAVDLPHTSTQFDLSLSLSEGSAGIVGSLEYASDLFDPASIERLAGYFQHLLGAMARDPQQSLATLPLLDDAGRRQVLFDFNNSSQDFPRGQLIQQLFEAQAARHGHATAVLYEDQQLSYRQLNSSANQLAHALLARGVKPDDRVALCMERGTEMVVAVLGILKAGAAYVPLDPAYPADRLAYLLTDSAPVALLTKSALRASLPALTMPVLALDAEPLLHYPDHNPDPHALGLTERHLAYVIHTSGSTGLPKGVMIEHRSLCNLARAQMALFDLDTSSRILQFASCSFDASIWEFVMALCAGASLQMAPKDALRPGAPLLETLQQQQITHVTLPSSAVAAWEDTVPLWASTLIVAGEACPPGLAQRWAGRVHFVNAYGPTEATVCATTYHCGSEERSSVPIGRPIANVQIYILDKQLQPVPIGVEGELYIGGAGLARGYLNQPELTAERFIPNPFDESGNGKIYRTGDLGRWLADGNIEYLGRNDFQVKLRGFRIELGEIEARLSACAGVAQCVVIAREDSPGDQRLVAYLIAQDGANLGPAALRAELAQTLPAHMLPTAFVTLAAFPLTSNGKLDRSALPPPGDDAYLARRYEAPLPGAEQLLARIWAELLKREHIGRHDNFFELGGHSLLAVTLIERLRAAGVNADARVLFQSPTLAALAASLDSTPLLEVPANGIEAGCTKIRPQMLPLLSLTQDDIDRIVDTVPGGAANIQDMYGLAPLQEGILFHHLMHTEGDTYLLSQLFAIDTRARLEQFLSALQAVIARHDILRTAIVWDGLPQAVQVVYREAALPVHEVMLTDGDAVAQMLQRFDSRRMRIDLRNAPLIQAHVARDNANERYLVTLLCHHLVADHTTLALMVDEVHAHLQGTADQLPAPLPFRNLIAQTHLGAQQEQHTAFFQNMLGDIDAPTAPFGLLDVQGNGSDIDQASMAVDSALAQQIRQCARSHAVSTASIFHLAWAMVLARLSGRTDVVFGTVLFGRMQGGDGADRALGLFINTLPLRLSLADRDIEHSLRATQEALSDLLQHEHASLALAQRCSAVAAPAPLFASLLNYRHSEVPDSARPAQSWDGIELLHGEERTNYPVALSVDDLGDGFTLAAQVHGIEEAARLCAYMHTTLANLIEALAQAPGTAAAAIDILPATEQRKLLVDWNTSAPDFVEEQGCIHQLFEAQAARTPDAIALAEQHAQMRYDELNSEANRLAHYLIGLGVRPDTRVAINAARGMNMIVGLLAILKAGAAYIPLDPAYPSDRLAWMVDDGAPMLLLSHGTDPQVWKNLPDSLPLIDMDRHRAQWRGCPDSNPSAHSLGLSGNHLAYLMYTSGSSGQPKGVMIEHRSLCNLAIAQIAGFGVESDSRVLQFASASFDACISEIMMTLCRGASLHLPAPGGILAGDVLVDFVRDHAITHATLPPAVLDAMAENVTLDSIRTLIVAGEAPSAALVRRWGKGRRLINAYGPTETTVCASQYDCVRADTGQPPIGRPLPHVRIYVLDESLRPAPIGVAGEIHIGGAGVARGYHNRPALTAERFLSDPFQPEPARMYKTGDLGRYQADGNIVFLGRNDGQLKLRGYRIETGEIETRLAAWEGIGAAVVTAKPDPAGGKRLVAYYTGETAIDSAILRRHLAAALPEYMLPAAFVHLAALPLTLNGKIDYRSLPLPETNGDTPRTIEEADGELEQTLARIWRDLLKIDVVGRHDHFFERGGHSLLAVQMLSQLGQAGIDINIATLFVHPTIAQLAAHITASKTALTGFVLANQGRDAKRAIAFRAGGDARPLFLVHEVSGELFYAHVLAPHIDAGIPLYGLPGPAKADAPSASIADAAQRLIGMLKEVQPAGPYRLAGWSFGGTLAYEIAAQLIRSGDAVEFLGLLDTAYEDSDAPATGPQKRDDKEVLLDLFLDPADIEASIKADLTAAAATLDFAALTRRLQAADVVPKRMSAHDVQRWISHWNGNVQAMQAYRPQAMAIDITLFVAQEQERPVTRGQLGWDALLAPGQIAVVPVSGTHQTMMEAPHCQGLGAALSAALKTLPH